MNYSPKNIIALFAILLWASTAAALLVHAQTASTPAKPVENAIQSGPELTDAALSHMLTELQYAPTALSKGYAITISRGNWNFNVQVRLSENHEKVGLIVNAGGVPHPEDVPAATWMKLLESNGVTDPTVFYFDPQQQRLYLHRTIDSRALTPEALRKELETFCEDVSATGKLWRFTK